MRLLLNSIGHIVALALSLLLFGHIKLTSVTTWGELGRLEALLSVAVPRIGRPAAFLVGVVGRDKVIAVHERSGAFLGRQSPCLLRQLLHCKLVRGGSSASESLRHLLLMRSDDRHPLMLDMVSRHRAEGTFEDGR